MTHYRRSSPDLWDELTAIAAGVAAGVGVAYLVRRFRQREPLEEGGGGADGSPPLPERGRPRHGAEADSGS